MAEQTPHSEQDGTEPSDGVSASGADLEPWQGRQQDVSELDAEQLRQFREFQEFRRFQELQRRAELAGERSDGEVTPLPAQPQSPPAGHERDQPRLRAPRWLKWLGKKVLAWLVFFVLTLFALNWVLQSVLGVSLFGDEQEGQPVTKSGGGTYHTNKILPTQPYEAVRSVYDVIAADKKPTYACGSFDQRSRQAFAKHLGYPTCEQAVRALQKRVSDVNAYAESIPSSLTQPVKTDTVRIRSCEFGVSGGPALGTFIVTEVAMGQWLITGHIDGPQQCRTKKTGSASAQPTR